LVFSKERINFVRVIAVHLECDARAPAGAVAEPVFAVEGGNLLRQKGRDAYREERAGIFLVRTVGATALFAMVGADGA
jgi:hypothetical protein